MQLLWLTWFLIWYHWYILEANKLQKKFRLVDIRNIFLDVGIRQPNLAVFFLVWILQYVIQNGVKNLDALKHSLVRLELDPHI